MPSTKPNALRSDGQVKFCFTDATGAASLASHLRGMMASATVEEADFSALPDVALVLVDAVRGFTSQARNAVAMAWTAGVPHVILAVAVHPSDDASVIEETISAFEDFAEKTEFASAVAVSLSLIARNGRDVLTDSNSKLTAHLTRIASAALQNAAEPSAAAPASEQFAAHIGCVSKQDLIPGREYRLRISGQETPASVNAIKYRLDPDTLRRVPARTLAQGEIGACTIATDVPLVLGGGDSGEDDSRFTLSDLYTDEVVAAGTVDFALRRGVNVHWHPFTVTKELRAAAKGQTPCIVWFTGLSGAGKSTVANLVEGWLALQGRHTYLLDGDNVRHGLNKDLGFTAADRVENIRRVGEVARLFLDAGTIVLCSFISPFRAEREAVRSLVGPGEFIEVYVTAPLDVCKRRDPKGLYAKSLAGHLPNFTGIDSPYEEPEEPDLVIDTTTAPAAELAQRVVALLQARGIVAKPDEHSGSPGSI